MLCADLYRYEGSRGLPAFWATYLKLPGFRYTVHLRIANAWRHSRHPFKWLFGRACQCILRQMGRIYGFQIPAGTSIGQGLYIGHHGTDLPPKN